MPKLQFTDDFDFWPAASNGNVSVAYKKGTTQTVTAECAARALAAGKAKEVKPAPSRKSEQGSDGAEE